METTFLVVSSGRMPRWLLTNGKELPHQSQRAVAKQRDLWVRGHVLFQQVDVEQAMAAKVHTPKRGRSIILIDRPPLIGPLIGIQSAPVGDAGAGLSQYV
mgnify:CR=1 FL=1